VIWQKRLVGRKSTMRDFRDRVAVVTGGASGIGRALARDLLGQGMKVVIADNSQARIDETLAELDPLGEVVGLAVDVARADQVDRLAAHTLDRFGAVHLLVSNAGVGGEHGATWEQSAASWDWVLGVNLWGAIHSIRAFVPQMLRQGEPAHVVCTSSLAGLRAMPYTCGYSATKYAVVAVCETLHQELQIVGAGHIGVSVVCPGPARTPILDPTRERPPGVAGPQTGGADAAQEEATRALITRLGAEPEEISAYILAAIRENRFWVFTHEGSLEWVEERTQRLRNLQAPTIATLDSLPAREPR
jgi:NAD(P)-dependent dehydrogenase (short-subunit alcohol dehydrogenase family)